MVKLSHLGSWRRIINDSLPSISQAQFVVEHSINIYVHFIPEIRVEIWEDEREAMIELKFITNDVEEEVGGWISDTRNTGTRQT